MCKLHYSTNLQKLDATKEGYTFSYNVCPVNNIDTIYFSICRTDFEKFVTSFLHVKSMGENHHHFLSYQFHMRKHSYQRACNMLT